MTTSVPVSAIKESTKAVLRETFDEVVGMFLDRGDSLWESLENVTAQEASIPVAEGSNSIAAQVRHMTFYFDVMAGYMRNEPPEKPDWGAAWKQNEVTDEEWQELKRALGERQAELFTLIDDAPEDLFSDPDIIGGTYAIVAHTAFHLGQIRHSLVVQGK